MLLSAMLFSFVVPVAVNSARATELISKPYLVQAVIDSARIIGLPPSKAAKAYAMRIQAIDPVMQQIVYVAEPISSRKLFFRDYFSESDWKSSSTSKS